VLIPSENVKDLADIPDNVKSALEIIPVATADEALAHALAGKLEPVEWREEDEPLPIPAADSDLDVSIAH
jgi:ATP-dependent Lon protease